MFRRFSVYDMIVRISQTIAAFANLLSDFQIHGGVAGQIMISISDFLTEQRVYWHIVKYNPCAITCISPL